MEPDPKMSKELEAYIQSVQSFGKAVYSFIGESNRLNYDKLRDACKSHQSATENSCAFALKVIGTRERDLAEKYRSELYNYINTRSGPLPSRNEKEEEPNNDLHALNVLRKLMLEQVDRFEQFPNLEPTIAEVANTLKSWYRLYWKLCDFVFSHGLGELIARKESLAAISDLGIDPYPHRFDHSHSISDIVERFEPKAGEQLQSELIRPRVAGKVLAINVMGKAGFLRITDGRELLQIYVRSNDIDDRSWRLFKLLHLGDFIGTEGKLFRTKTDELSIHAESLTFLAKALLPPPDKYYGLHDIEIRYRQRYADLIANRDVRRVFEKRAQIVRLIRTFFDARGYIEVETPMLTPLPTGAAARPFVTHHNALDIDLYARIAPELYLKRLIVGGFEKVYEINRNFRNEGIDRSHNPEFTMLEFYEAYSDFESLVELTESLISGLVEQVCGQKVVQYGEQKIDFTRPWKRMTMREAVIHYWPDPGDYTARQVLAVEIGKEVSELQARARTAEDQALIKEKLNQDEPWYRKPTVEDLSTREGILRCVERLPALKSQIAHLKSLSYGYLLGEVFEHIAEPRLIDPTFITEFPTELSPLSKQSETDPAFVDRFELFISGMEIANAFCEINDPKDQQARFEAQMTLRQGGDDEAMLIDEDYIRALSYGMPPTAGEGIGIDRLVMVLTDSRSIRDVILFPHMRPERAVAGGQSPVARNTDEDAPDN
jgi:lysyl-tRNA synthetase class 2